MARCNRLLPVLISLLSVTPLLAQEWSPFGPTGGAIQDGVVDPATGTIYIYGTTHGIHRLDPGDSVWQQVATPGPERPNTWNMIEQLSVAGGRLFARFGCCMLYRSDDRGASWEPVNFPFAELRSIGRVVDIGDTLFLRTMMPYVLFRSLDGGAVWTPLDTSDQYAALASNGRALYDYGPLGLRQRNADGVWVSLRDGAVDQLLLDGDTLIALDEQARLHRSYDAGETWQTYPAAAGDEKMTQGERFWIPWPLALHNDTIVALRSTATVAMPVGGSQWRPWGSIDPPSLLDRWSVVDRLLLSDRTVLAVGMAGTFRRDPAAMRFLPFDAGQYGMPIRQIVRLGDTVIVRTLERLHITADRGATWETRTGPGGNTTNPLTLHGGRLYSFGGSEGVVGSTDGGRTWSTTPVVHPEGGSFTITGLHVSDTILYVTGPGILRRTPGSGGWTLLPTPTLHYVTMIAGAGDTLFAKSNNDAAPLIRSLDRGDTWEEVELLAPAAYVSALGYANGTLYVGTTNDGLHRSEDAGTTWRRSFGRSNQMGDTMLLGVLSLDVFGDTLFVRFPYSNDGTFLDRENLVYATHNRGDNWQALRPPPGGALMFHPLGDRLLAGTDSASVQITQLTLDADNRRATESGVRIMHDPAYDHIRWSTPAPTSYAIDLYTIGGEHVMTVERGEAEAGEHVAVLPELAGGVYLCTIRTAHGDAGILVRAE